MSTRTLIAARSVEDITEQGQALDQVDGIREIRNEDDVVFSTLGSGYYHFSIKMR